VQKEKPKIVAERSPFGWRSNENGVQATYLPTWLRYRALGWNPAVKRYCRARLQNFDVVHIFGLYDLLGPAVAGACRVRNIPYVLEPIGMFVPIVRNFLLKTFYHFAWGRRLFEGASAVIATSDQEAKELAAGGVPAGKIILRRNGVEIPVSWPEPGVFRRAHGIAQDAKLILFLGRLSAKKSPDLLLQAFAKLPTELEGKPLQLVFAGPDEDGMIAELEQKASQLSVRTRIQFVGSVFGESKWAAYRDADVFVLPSQNENFGNTAAEAVAAGTPVVVTEQCGIAPLVAGEAGLVVPHDSGAVSDALAHVLGAEEMHARFAAGCAKAASRLGWSEPVSEMETLYARLASQLT
jgi:glycosyltransferase involved in cell wall biosynthesis